MRLSGREFEQLVAEALDLVPGEIRSHMDNVQIVIEDEPEPELLADMGMEPDETLYGLYTGIPLTERSTEYSALPDRITIFRLPLLEDFIDRDELRREVARTVIHEIAHHFGIDDDRLADLGWD